jgi:hypothetical protein
VQQLLKGHVQGRACGVLRGESSREAAVYRGTTVPDRVGDRVRRRAAGDETARVIRFANRVPLLFQQSACSSFKAVTETNWRNYDLQQPRSSVPIGPLVIMIHMASVWVPFTSESKEAIADYDEIRKEMRLALMECGRKLGGYLSKRLKMRREAERRDVFERYIGEISQAINAITGDDAKQIYEALLTQAKKRTAIADLKLDEEGKKIKEEAAADEEGVIIVQSAAANPIANTAAPAKSKGPQIRTVEDDGPSLIEAAEKSRKSGKAPEAKSPEKKAPERKTAGEEGTGEAVSREEGRREGRAEDDEARGQARAGGQAPDAA